MSGNEQGVVRRRRMLTSKFVEDDKTISSGAQLETALNNLPYNKIISHFERRRGWAELLLTRVVSCLNTTSRTCPFIIATH